MSVRVRLVTTWGKACGIAEHSKMLCDALWACTSDFDIEVTENLHPDAVVGIHRDVLVLNYHAALHSQWTPDAVRRAQLRSPVVIIYHDTGVPNSDQAKALYAVADAFIVHEPCEDLPGAIYWRQGVPRPQTPYRYGVRAPELGRYNFLAYAAQPVLGTVGFPFPWKNYTRLAEATAAAGWALLLLAPTADESQIATWTAANPHTMVGTDFIPADTVVAYLAGCDATAFLYTCANTGTSGAIRQGMAARKPVLATAGCRQFRDLQQDPVGRRAITWLEDLSIEGVAEALTQVSLQRVSPPIVRLAEQDGWAGLGRRYARLLREVAGRGVGVGDGHGTPPHAEPDQQIGGQP